MRAKLALASVYCLVYSSTFAADNSKQIERILHNHGEAIAKANDIRAKAIEKSRSDAVAQLTKMATAAYSEKDRLAETNAWKTVLMMDRSNAKATQYFKDLGTLEQVLKTIPEDTSGGNLFRIAGKWRVSCDNKVQFDVDIAAEGVLLTDNKKTAYPKLTTDKDSITFRRGEVVDRYTVAGNKLLFEQWYPFTTYPASGPSNFGIASRVE